MLALAACSSRIESTSSTSASTTSSATGICPVNVLNPVPVQVATSLDYSAAVLSDGSFWCWGSALNGTCNQLGFYAWYSPVRGRSASCLTEVAVSDNYVVGVRFDGSVIAWGDEFSGAFGDGPGTTADHGEIATVLLPEPAVHAAAGNAAFAVGASGRLYTWGKLDKGLAIDVPVQVPGLDSIVKVETGADVCALNIRGELYCWGTNHWGGVGDGTLIDREEPSGPILSDVLDFSVGQLSTCAIRSDRSVWCWGDNEVYQLGDGTNVSRPAPVRTLPMPEVVGIRLGGESACAWTATGELYCWGRPLGELFGATPAAETSLGGPVTQAAADYSQVCALLADASVWCRSVKGGLVGQPDGLGPVRVDFVP